MLVMEATSQDGPKMKERKENGEWRGDLIALRIIGKHSQNHCVHNRQITEQAQAIIGGISETNSKARFFVIRSRDRWARNRAWINFCMRVYNRWAGLWSWANIGMRIDGSSLGTNRTESIRELDVYRLWRVGWISWSCFPRYRVFPDPLISAIWVDPSINFPG